MEASLLFVTATILVSFISGIESTTLTITNNCPYTIWIGAQDNANVPSLGNTGFELPQSASSALNPPVEWGGRFWARTGCTTDASGRFMCATADCGSGQIPCNGNGGAPPATLAEFTLNGNGGSQDNYDVSNVDGFNVPVEIAPSNSGCTTTSCSNNVNSACPSDLAVTDSSGNVIGCKSACIAFGGDAYCCTGANSTPQTCNGDNPYSQFFKSECPQAYSYAYDDASSLFTCPSGGDYVITFCP